jgi:hypothetical protein
MIGIEENGETTMIFFTSDNKFFQNKTEELSNNAVFPRGATS